MIDGEELEIYQIGDYHVHLYIDSTYTKHSADNKHQYDCVYCDTAYENSTKIGIKIYQNQVQLRSTIIGADGGATSLHPHSIIIEKDRIVVCCADSVFCLAVPDLSLQWCTRADCATCFEIYSYHDSYIIHGEMEISRIDRNGKILWSQGGSDIFTTHQGIDDFTITGGYIRAVDWNLLEHKFDFDGNRLD